VTVFSLARPHDPKSDDRRAHDRTVLPAKATYLSALRLILCPMGDLSASGAFLSTTTPDPVGTHATLRFFLAGEEVQVAAVVVRVSFFGGRDGRAAGMGLLFVDVPRDLRRRLMAAFERHA
jgi:hypothetical protein